MNIIFYDGTCGMCHWAVQWVAKRDTKRIFQFAPLDGKTAQAKLKGLKLPDSVVYLEDGQVLLFSRAAFRIFWRLGGLWALLGWLSFLPDWMLIPSDWVYRQIAKRRAQSCDLSIRGDTRFLD